MTGASDVEELEAWSNGWKLIRTTKGNYFLRKSIRDQIRVSAFRDQGEWVIIEDSHGERIFPEMLG